LRVAPMSNSHGPTNPSGPSNCRQFGLNFRPRPIAIRLRDIGKHCVWRTEGLALETSALSCRTETQRSINGVNFDLSETGTLVRLLKRSSSARLNGPGRPGAGGDKLAIRRMIPTGMEKKPFFGGWNRQWQRSIPHHAVRGGPHGARAGIGGTQLPAAIRVGHALVAREPYRETGYRLLMDALACQGNKAEALRIYEKLRRRLRDDLGVSPSAESQELPRQLLRSCHP